MKRTSSSRVRRIEVAACLFAANLALWGCSGGEDNKGPETDSSTEDTDSTTATTGSSGGTDGKPDEGTAPGGVKLIGTPEYHAFVRLTHTQWKNAVTDIFGLQPSDLDALVTTLYPDPPSGKFSNNEKALYIGPELWADHQRVAEELARTIATDALVVASLGTLSNPGGFIDKVGHRAYRRPLTAEEKAAFLALWDLGATYYDSGDAGVDGARVFLEALLQSPHFLYRIESAEPGTRLSGPELITKLSFLLKNTTPSAALLTAAEAGDFDSDEALREAAMTMLSEDATAAMALTFHTELYGLDRYKNIEKSTATFPNFTEETKNTLLLADQMFFQHIFDSDGGVREIFTSPVAYANQQLARYYGLRATGAALTQVTLDETRPGYLTRLGFLTYNSTLSQSDPIHRGVDINLRMLCEDLNPPAGVIPPLPEPLPNQTNRQRVEAHTEDASCAKCHAKIINPLGFAFENFDAVGQARTMDAGQPIDTASSYEFNDGLRPFADAPELIAIMAEHEQTHSCYSAMLTQFVLGRDVSSKEEALVAAVQSASFNDDASTKQLILTLIGDPMFTHAQAGGTP